MICRDIKVQLIALLLFLLSSLHAHEIDDLTVTSNSGENVALLSGQQCSIQCRIVNTAAENSHVEFEWYKDGISFINDSWTVVFETGSYHCVARLKVNVSGCINWRACDDDTDCYQGTECSGGTCCVIGMGEVEIEKAIGPSDIIQVYVDPAAQQTYSPHGPLLEGAMEIRCPVPNPPNFHVEFDITWYKDNVELLNHNSPALLLNNIDVHDMGDYRCEYQICGDGDAFVATAFSVITPVNMDAAGSPTIHLSSTILPGVGDNFTVICLSPRLSPGVTYNFWIDSVQQAPPPDNSVSVIATNETIEFKCKASFNGYTSSFSDSLFVHGSNLHTITIYVDGVPTENFLHLVGLRFTFTCEVEYFAPGELAVFSWVNSDTNALLQQGPTYTVILTEAMIPGFPVTCIAETVEGDQLRGNVLIRAEYPRIPTVTSSGTFSYRETETLFCDAQTYMHRGNVYRWFEDGIQLFIDDATYPYVDVIPTEDETDYQCQYTYRNIFGQESQQSDDYPVLANCIDHSTITIGGRYSPILEVYYGVLYPLECSFTFKSGADPSKATYSIYVDDAYEKDGLTDIIEVVSLTVYYCKVNHGDITVNTDSLQIKGTDLPTPTIIPPEPEFGNLYTYGNVYSLTCQSTASHTRLTYEWFDENDQIIAGEESMNHDVTANITTKQRSCRLVIDNVFSDRSNDISILSQDDGNPTSPTASIIIVTLVTMVFCNVA